MFCYLESAIKVRRWTSSLVHTFADSDKIKFDIVFSKDQQVARFDRIVAFAFASTGTDKFVTNRVVFNIGLQMEAQNEQSKDQGSVCAQIVRPSALEPMETVGLSGAYENNNRSTERLKLRSVSPVIIPL
ncbi:hypothetical protein NECAME_00275 [Necator americanus]|uniref:Uncharacterized protein n=1 Tax=Necator americanus TaxID=51031 RepID=W2TJX0_NECAM|nr:hypothetical protein NECAME_00275 [Necator americanus]ETN81924.1 hypothetical protein NECAME_00275 [Necator americanus]